MRPSLTLIAALLLSPAAARAEVAYVSSDVWSAVIRVDLETGARQMLDLDSYPRIIKATDYLVEPDGSLVVDTINAQQLSGLFRVHPQTLALTPLSGAVLMDTGAQLGDGPEFRTHKSTLVANDRALYVIQQQWGIMEVDLATGNRRIVSTSEDEEPVGDGVPMAEPLDLVLTRENRLLVLDQFQGLLEVDIPSGTRKELYDAGRLPTAARHMDILPDGRLIFTAGAIDLPAVWQMTLETGEIELLSGSFGGHEAGNGPAFELAGDVMITRSGRILVYDGVQVALFEVGLDGSRRIVTQDTGAPEEEPLYGILDKPILGTETRPVWTGSWWGVE